MKALDVYFGLCFIYVFGALIEFACVCYLDKHFKTKTSQKAAQEKEKSLADERASQNRHLIRTIDSFGTPRDPRYCKKKTSKLLLYAKNVRIQVIYQELL